MATGGENRERKKSRRRVQLPIDQRNDEIKVPRCSGGTSFQSRSSGIVRELVQHSHMASTSDPH